MKTRQVIWLVVIVVIAAGGIYWKLSENKSNLESQVAFAQKKVEAIPVKVKKAKMMKLERQVQSNGTLQANQQLTVVSETQGKVIHLYKDLGDYVKKGEVIAKVEDETIAASVMVAEANVDQQEKDIKRYKRLNEGNAITKHDLEQAEIGLKKAKADLIKARKALDNTSVTAPIPGIINKKFITEGQFLGGGTPVCEIVDNAKIKLHVSVDGSDIYHIDKGQKVDVKIPVFPDSTFRGTVTAIGVKADRAMKFDVEITLNNSGPVTLKSGLFAEVHFPFTAKESLVIPSAAIPGSMENPRVFVVENGKAVRKDIVTGISNNDVIEVISGLKPGEQVIYSGQLNLAGGENVKIVN